MASLKYVPGNTLRPAIILATLAVLAWVTAPASAAPLRDGFIVKLAPLRSTYLVAEEVTIRATIRGLDQFNDSDLTLLVAIRDPTGAIAYEGEQSTVVKVDEAEFLTFDWTLPPESSEGTYTVTAELTSAYGDELYDTRDLSDEITFTVVSRPLLGVSAKQPDLGVFARSSTKDSSTRRIDISNLSGAGRLDWKVEKWPRWLTGIDPVAGTGDGPIVITTDGARIFDLLGDQTTRWSSDFRRGIRQFSDEILISSNGGSTTVSVSFRVRGETGGSLGFVTPQGNRRQYQQGDEVPIEFTVENSGDVPTDYRVRLRVLDLTRRVYSQGGDVKVSLRPSTSLATVIYWNVPIYMSKGRYGFRLTLEEWSFSQIVYDSRDNKPKDTLSIREGPRLQASPTTWDVGRITQGESPSQAIVLDNVGRETADLEYKVTTMPKWLEPLDSPTGFAPGRIKLQVSPSAPPGEHQAFIAITSNGGTQRVTVTVTVDEAPTPTPNPELTATPIPEPTATPEPTTVAARQTLALSRTPRIEPPSVPEALLISDVQGEPTTKPPQEPAAAPPVVGACSPQAAEIPLMTGMANLLLLFAPLALTAAMRSRRR